MINSGCWATALKFHVQQVFGACEHLTSNLPVNRPGHVRSLEKAANGLSNLKPDEGLMHTVRITCHVLTQYVWGNHCIRLSPSDAMHNGMLMCSLFRSLSTRLLLLYIYLSGCGQKNQQLKADTHTRGWISPSTGMSSRYMCTHVPGTDHFIPAFV